MSITDVLLSIVGIEERDKIKVWKLDCKIK